MGGQFGLVGPTYISQSLRQDGQRCVNFYPEHDETGQGLYEWTMYGTPGTKLLYDLGAKSVRCIFSNGSRTFAVSGASLWELKADLSKVEVYNLLAEDVVRPAYISYGINQLMVVSGLHGYCFLPDNTVVVDPPGLENPMIVDYCDGYFVVMRNDGKWQVTLDGTDWTDPGFISAASVFAEPPISLICDHRQVILWSAKRGAFYQNTGNAFPFDVISGGEMELGIEAIDSPVRFDNSVGWIGSDERGGRIIWKIGGQAPQRISSHGIEHLLKGLPTVSDAMSWSYQEEGHTFAAWYFPSGNATIVYDAATNMWHERTYFDDIRGTHNAHLGRAHSYSFGKHLIGSRVDGKIYEMSLPVVNGGGWDFVTDAGKLIHRYRICPPISRENQRDRYDSMEIITESGLGPQPPLQGNAPATVLAITDEAAVSHDFVLLDDGVTFNFSPATRAPQVFKLKDPGNTTTWSLTLTADLLWKTTAIAFDATQPTSIEMVTAAGTLRYEIRVTAGGLLQTVLTERIARDPQMILSWSEDGTRTWNVNPRILNCGQAGAFKRRALTQRLGSSRQRNFKVECSDPIPWRILGGSLKGDQFEAEERAAKKAGKSL